MEVRKVKKYDQCKKSTRSKELRCIRHHISSDNPANWKEDINNTFIVVFNYIGYLINKRCKKKYW